MRFITRATIVLLCLSCCLARGYTQANSANSSGITDFPFKVFDKITARVHDLEGKIMERTEKTLQRLKKQERKIRKKLYKKDSALAKSVFEGSPDRYEELAEQLRSNNFKLNKRKAGEFLPNFDTVKTMLAYLGSDNQLLNNTGAGTKAQEALAAMTGVQEKLKYVAEIRNYISNRKKFLNSMLGKHDVNGLLKNMSKDVYYYGQYMQEYKAVLNDPSKMEKLAVNVLNKIPAFREFVQKNSFLSSLFAPNDLFASNGGPNINMPGLQTRDQVAQLLNTNVASAGANGADILGQRLADVRSQLDNLKQKISGWDESAEMPDFKPNEMKSKSFLQKIEFGTSLQFGKSNSFLPSTADIAGQVAYKFHHNGSVGLGASYKLGFGSLRNISFTHQGLGLRSFLDYKIKGSFYVNGGFEYNYNAGFQNVDQLRNLSAWQSSALMGLSKKYRISPKIKGNIVLLYDFLHKAHMPATQPLVFRFGYNF